MATIKPRPAKLSWNRRDIECACCRYIIAWRITDGETTSIVLPIGWDLGADGTYKPTERAKKLWREGKSPRLRRAKKDPLFRDSGRMPRDVVRLSDLADQVIPVRCVCNEVSLITAETVNPRVAEPIQPGLFGDGG